MDDCSAPTEVERRSGAARLPDWLRKGETMNIGINYVSMAGKNHNFNSNNCVSKSNPMSDFSAILNKVKDSNVNKSRDSYSSSFDYSYFGIYTYSDATKTVTTPIETDRYKIADASYMEGVPAYELVDKMSGTTLYIREDQMCIQRDYNTGLEFIMNMDLEQPIPPNILVTDELKGLLGNLSEQRNFELKETSLQGGLVVNHDPSSGLNYLSINGNESKAVSLIITFEKDIETINKLVEDFQQYTVSSQRETAGLYSLLEISGNLKRETEGFVYLTPIGLTYIPYDGDPNKAWETDIPSSYSSKVRAYLANGTDCTDINTWKNMINGIKVYYSDNYEGASINNKYKYDESGNQFEYVIE